MDEDVGASELGPDRILKVVRGVVGVLVKLIVRLSNSDQRKAFRETLHKIRAEIVALKLKD